MIFFFQFPFISILSFFNRNKFPYRGSKERSSSTLCSQGSTSTLKAAFTYGHHGHEAALQPSGHHPLEHSSRRNYFLSVPSIHLTKTRERPNHIHLLQRGTCHRSVLHSEIREKHAFPFSTSLRPFAHVWNARLCWKKAPEATGSPQTLRSYVALKKIKRSLNFEDILEDRAYNFVPIVTSLISELYLSVL